MFQELTKEMKELKGKKTSDRKTHSMQTSEDYIMHYLSQIHPGLVQCH